MHIPSTYLLFDILVFDCLEAVVGWVEGGEEEADRGVDGTGHAGSPGTQGSWRVEELDDFKWVHCESSRSGSMKELNMHYR